NHRCPNVIIIIIIIIIIWAISGTICLSLTDRPIIESISGLHLLQVTAPHPGRGSFSQSERRRNPQVGSEITDRNARFCCHLLTESSEKNRSTFTRLQQKHWRSTVRLRKSREVISSFLSAVVTVLEICVPERGSCVLSYCPN
ncbi:hypothetical protein JZ751_019641, partial [Albula glossodonta]